MKLISSSASIVISLSLVLYVIGLLAYILINTNSFSKKIKENITFSILLKDSAKEIDIVKFQKYIDAEDFAKNSISVEVAFNHAEAIAHNIIKPVLASELNHVQKEIQTKLGIIVTATENMKSRGNFDGAIGTFEQFIEYFKPYSAIVPTPIVLIGIEAPETFLINKELKEVQYI